MRYPIEEQIAALPTLDKGQLIACWKEQMANDPPPKLRKELMVPILAYRIQEKAYGGLSQIARRRIRELARSLASEKRLVPSLAPSLKTGTRLVRCWQGQLHEVTVSVDGFEYGGRTYDNLSTIAREITGTRWSGPLFFGTKRKVL